MNTGAIRPSILQLKDVDFSFERSLSSALSSLTPGESQPPTPSESGQSTPITDELYDSFSAPSTLGGYKFIQRISGVSSHHEVLHYDVIEILTCKKFLCKIFPSKLFKTLHAPYYAAGDHDRILPILEVIHQENKVFVIHPRVHGDLHTYLRYKRRLEESEACILFKQIVDVVSYCHSKSIVLRDLKLRKFIFTDSEQKTLALDSFEDAIVLDKYVDDKLDDKHGCPAYVSPEIISRSVPHSGRAADLWSLGVIAYILMVGRYPFHHKTPSLLFNKIRRAKFTIPDTISFKGRNLINCLLKFEPEDRMTASRVIKHPWFRYIDDESHITRKRVSCSQDQCVPQSKIARVQDGNKSSDSDDEILF